MFGDDDFDFIPDMDGDGDHDMIDFMILDTILSEDEKREEEEDDDILSTSDVDDDDWRDEHDEGYEFDVDPYDYDTEDEYLDAWKKLNTGGARPMQTTPTLILIRRIMKPRRNI